jgi:hypothetical protein
MKRLPKIVSVVCLFFFVTQVFGEPKKRCISPASAKKYIEANQTVRIRSALKPLSYQAGNIIVLPADSDLLTLSNTFDLQNLTIRFHPVSKGRYAYTLEPSSFDGQTSEQINLGDDDTRELAFKNFHFPFGRKTYDRCYINSNGSITFGSGDIEPPAVDSVSQGLPRIAAFFADLNPVNAGAILTHQTSERVLISWLKVPEFFNQNQFDYGENTFQIVLYRSGVIDIVFTKEFTATQGIVGLIPGNEKSQIRSVDFSSRKSTGRQWFSFVENFRDYVSVDIPSLMKTLYENYPDQFDFVSLFSNFDLSPIPGVQAFALNVQNNVRGIGNPSDKKNIFNETEKYGSSGKLQNITFFGNLHQYPDDPSRKFSDGEVSLLDILAHEVGHRWLSYIKLSKDGAKSDVLLGRDKSHWSFFLDTDGSFLEGNQIIPRSSNSFQTGSPFQRYSDLDLYLMGLKSPAEVRDTVYVAGASNFSPDFPFSPDSGPESDVKFNGTAVPVTIDEIIAVNGQRRPGTGGAQKDFKHLFVLISKTDLPPSDEEIAFLETIRAHWSDYFYNATDGAGTMDTVLEQ